jgi:hypothetical protein
MTIENENKFTVITADTGNVFRSKISGDVLTDRLYLGCNDSADNYEEISEVEAYAEAEEEISENGVF